MTAARNAGWLATVLVVGAGCGGSLRVASLDDMERVRASESVRTGAELAPEVYARAERERDLARHSHAMGDDVSATIQAEHAIAAYSHALVVARRARAAAELADATRGRDEANAQEQALDATRASTEHEAADLEARERVARDRLLPAPSASATPDREAARLVAARSLSVEAALLCGAAKLLAPEGDGVAGAEGDVTALARRLEKPVSPVPIDEAGRVRSRCLSVLTASRRRLADTRGQSDALLAELSAAGGWDPARDERGVVVTLRAAFNDAKITPEADEKLRELARVASAHPAFGLQVVVHDASSAPHPGSVDGRRAEAAVQALVAGGASDSRIQSELVGGGAPVVDPSDAHAAARNERLEVVFVGP